MTVSTNKLKLSPLDTKDLRPISDTELNEIAMSFMDTLLDDEMKEGAVRIWRMIIRIRESQEREQELLDTIKELRECLGHLVDRVDRNDGLGEYNGGQPFIMKTSRRVLDKTKDIV